jgi:HK97 family phage portal protein
MNLFKRIQYAVKHRGQPGIQIIEGERVESERSRFYFEKSYDAIEVVRRGTDLIVDSATDVDLNITDVLPVSQTHEGPKQRRKTLAAILNFRPNANEDINEFRRQLYMDLILTGNCYQYWDGKDLFQLPSKLVTIKTGKRDKILGYEYQDSSSGGTKFSPREIIHTKDNAAHTIYSGASRLYPTRDTINILRSMLAFQENFFDNGAIPGLVIQTPNILGDRIKTKLLNQWRIRFNPKTGGKQPMILDGDLKINPLSATKFSELDFETSIKSHELKILKVLGVPPVLLDSGNNANLRPNIQLFYEMTVLPLVSKLISSYERFFAYDMEPDVAKVRALRPELRDAAQYYQGLVNTGIITINEARLELRLDESTEEHASKLRVPQNIAGSAEDPTEGGRPPSSDDESDNGEEESSEGKTD